MKFNNIFIKEGTKQEEGVVLIVALLVFLALNLIMVVAVKSTTRDTMIAVNYRDSIKAFYDAEAGIHYALAKIESGLIDGSLGSLENFSLNYKAPEGFSFNFNSFMPSGENLYQFISIGHAGDASCMIEVRFRRKPHLTIALPFGIFADIEVDQKSIAGCYSYDSKIDPNGFLNRNESRGHCYVASNRLVVVRNNALIDGDILLGEYDDAQGNLKKGDIEFFTNPNRISGARIDVERIYPDPLNVFKLVATYENNNNNAAVSGIVKNKIELEQNIIQTLIIPPGNYYLNGLVLDRKTHLIINAQAGAVNFYIHDDGSMPDTIINAKANSQITVVGLPTHFSIFCDSTKRSLEFKHASDYTGLLYAPFAEVVMHNKADVKGLIWCRKVDIENSGAFWHDTAITENFTVTMLSNDLQIVSWNEILK